MRNSNSKCIAYTRVSSLEQVDGYSLTFQENDIKKFAISNNLEIIKFFVEKGKSAKTVNRAELKNMISYCKKNAKSIDFLIIWDFQRLARNVFDHLSIEKQLKDLDISILSVKEFNTDTPQSRLYRTVMGAVNQFDNEERGLKSKSGMEQAILEGRWIYGVPFGYSYKECLKGKKIITPNDKQYIVKELFQSAASGLYSTSTLVKMFETKIPNLSLKYLKRIISNELYIGYINTEKTPERIKGIHVAIISESLFWEAQKIYKPKQKPHSVYNDFPLNGFAKHKGAPLSGCWARGKTKKYRHYRTHKIKFNISADKAESLFLDKIKELSIKKEIIDILLNSINDYFDHKNANKSDRISHLNKELLDCSKKRKKIEALLIDSIIDKKTYLEHKTEIEQKINSLKSELKTLSFKKCNNNEVKQKIIYKLSDLSETWKSLSNTDKQAFQRLLLPQGVEIEKSECRTLAKSFILNTLDSIKTVKNKIGVADGIINETSIYLIIKELEIMNFIFRNKLS